MYSDKEVYGQIEYFFVHSYSGNQRMLAFIQWISEVYIILINMEQKGFKVLVIMILLKSSI